MKIKKETANIYDHNRYYLNSEYWIERLTAFTEVEQGKGNIVIYISSDYLSIEESKTHQTKPLYAEVI